MRISTKGRYALRVLLDLAEHAQDANVSIRQVAERQEVSEKYLEGIVRKLNKAGLVASVRGKYGGYRLAKPTTEYTILEILLATEDNMTIVACLEEDVYCSRVGICKTVGFWQQLQDHVHAYLKSVTLQDILDGSYKEIKM